jgi:hypothetical protein
MPNVEMPQQHSLKDPVDQQIHSINNTSYSPSPLMAMEPCTCHLRFFSSWSPSASHSSAVVTAPAWAAANKEGFEGLTPPLAPSYLQSISSRFTLCFEHTDSDVTNERQGKEVSVADQVLFVGEDQDGAVPHERVLNDGLHQTKAPGRVLMIQFANSRYRSLEDNHLQVGRPCYA